MGSGLEPARTTVLAKKTTMTLFFVKKDASRRNQNSIYHSRIG